MRRWHDQRLKETSFGGGRMKRVLVSLPDKIYQLIDKELRGKMGESDSEIIRTIVIAYLSEKGYVRGER